MSRAYRISEEELTLANKTAVEHVCTVSDVKDLMYRLCLEDSEKLKWVCRVYGGLRDLGLEHYQIVNNFNLIYATTQILKLMQMPDPFKEPPSERLIRED